MVPVGSVVAVGTVDDVSSVVAIGSVTTVVGSVAVDSDVCPVDGAAVIASDDCGVVCVDAVDVDGSVTMELLGVVEDVSPCSKSWHDASVAVRNITARKKQIVFFIFDLLFYHSS